ncbi:MAG: hypothetical protein GF331_02610 [Chitinivibrionales bacterium]|nr:hypothetical protein [Chitinivibrionales bacterium]
MPRQTAPSPRLAKAVSRFSRCSVLVVGDVSLDELVWGRACALSPDSLAPVVRVTREEQRPGAAGAVAGMLAGLGVNVHLVSVVGADEDGERLRHALQDIGVGCEAIFSSRARTTTRITRTYAQGMQVGHIERAAHCPLVDDELRLSGHHIRSVASEIDAAVVVDDGKGVVTEELARLVIDTCRDHDTPVVESFATDWPSRETSPDAVIVDYFGARPNDGASSMHDSDPLIERGGRESLDRSGVSSVLMYLRDKGLALFRKGHKKGRRYPLPPNVAIELTDAREAAVAVFSAALACGAPHHDAASLACCALGLAASRVGPVWVDRRTLTSGETGGRGPKRVGRS